jgi:hypothetical protein
MGTAAAENVAVRINTSADTSGVTAARTDLGSLGAEAEKVAADTSKLTVSAEQMSAALQKTGGDIQKAGQLLAAEAQAAQRATVATETLAGATDSLAGATERETQQTEESVVVDEKKIRSMGLLETAALKEDNARALVAERQAVRDAAELQNMGKLEAAAYAEDAARTAASEKAEVAGAKISGSARTASNALGIMTQAALTGNGSLAGMATAAGGLATGLSAISGSAKLAAGAAGIGALITVGVLLYETYKKAKEEVTATVSASFSEHLQGITLTGATAALAAARQRAEQANAAAAAAATGDIRDLLPGTKSMQAQKDLAQANADYEALVKRVAALRQQERDRAIELAQSSRDQIASNKLDLALEQQKAQAAGLFLIARTQQNDASLKAYADAYGATKSEFALREQGIQNEQKQAAAAIAQQFRHRDASGQIVALTAEEVRLRGILLDQNDAIARAKQIELEADREAAQIAQRAAILQGSDSVYDRTQGRLIAIEQERQAEIKKTGDILAANEAAEQKKRALYGETAKQASDDAKTIFDVFRNSSNSTLKAIGTFGENLRRVVIGAEAARALVNAATESAAAIASLAVGDFRGAALHGEAALSYGAAAALGARESLGGGGSGGGASGGGGGDGGGGSTFTPNQQPAGGTTVINLITTDPYGRESINRVSWQLQRNGTLNVPIYPTSGVAMVPG